MLEQHPIQSGHLSVQASRKLSCSRQLSLETAYFNWHQVKNNFHYQESHKKLHYTPEFLAHHAPQEIEQILGQFRPEPHSQLGG
jgi:hypothetical protein